jgi:shikimate kinase
MRLNKWIFLVGFSGSGKSTLGRTLASRLNWRFVDLDSHLEKQAGRSIATIFKTAGEAAFRRMERGSLRQLLTGRKRGVMALGGGAFESARVRALVRRRGISVYLSSSLRELYRRLKDGHDRPLLNVSLRAGETPRQARLRCMQKMLDRRLANYRRADFIVSTTGKTVNQSAAELLRLLKDAL